MKLKPPWKRNAALPKKRIRAEDNAPVDPVIPQAWEIVRDILYRMPLCRNAPKEFCPGEQLELVSREIAKALT